MIMIIFASLNVDADANAVDSHSPQDRHQKGCDQRAQ